MYQDFLGNELNIGDNVAFWDRYHKHFKKGVIYKFYNVKLGVKYNIGMDNVTSKDIFAEDCIKIDEGE